MAAGKAAIVVLDKDDPTRVKRSIAYAELVAMIRAAANRLHAVSAGTQPVVSILTPLVPEAFIALWAGITAGIANPINPFLRIDSLIALMNAAGTTVLVCSGDPHLQLAELRSRVPTLRAVWSVDEASGVDSFDQQIKTARSDQLEFQTPHDESRTAVLMHTGGTSAAPKLVRQTQRGQLLSAWCTGAWGGSDSEVTIANGVPYFHVTGAVVVALRSMVFGQTMIIVGPDGYRNPLVVSRFWDLVKAHGVTHAVSAPTTAAALVAGYNGSRPPTDFAFLAGGSAVPIQIAREFEDKFHIPLFEGWGMTELHGALIANPVGTAPRTGSIGIPFPYHRVRCIQTSSRSATELVPAGEVGVLAISGPCVTQGYLDVQQTRELFLATDSDPDPWLNSGDLAMIDGDGYVWVRGRAKDLIIRGGHNIDPLTIEVALAKHPAVLYAAAVGEPDRDKGELPVAYVQLRQGTSASEAELLDHCQRELAERAAVPRAVWILDTMPLTAVGKIFKPALRLDATQRCVRKVIEELSCAGEVEVKVHDAGSGLCVALRGRSPEHVEVIERIRKVLECYTFSVQVESPTPWRGGIVDMAQN
jgi:fatty-acyl-CoA synthase